MASLRSVLRGQRTPDAQPPDDIPEAAPNLAPPPGNPRFPLFDSLRAIAALSVFLGHTVTETQVYGPHPKDFPLAVFAAEVADQGVAIFFLISGFLLYRPFLAARRSGRTLALRDFARRRILRIVPAYWIALTLFLITGLVSGVTAHNWWIFYGFGQIYSVNTIGGGIGAAWTLCIEVTFYAALPVFAFAAARFGRNPQSVRGDIALLTILVVASLAFRAHFHTFASYATVSTLPGTFTWFALGMALAILSVTQEGRPQAAWLTRFVVRRPTVCWLLAAGCFALLYHASRTYSGVTVEVATHALYGVVALLILLPGVLGDAAGGLARRALRFPALAWIGLISYAFYLYHTIVIAQVNKLAVDAHVPQKYVFVLVLSFVISCICAALSYYVFERPIMRLRAWPTIPRLRRRDPRDAGAAKIAADGSSPGATDASGPGEQPLASATASGPANVGGERGVPE
jgi:peptidoglycan/LPS O-acetylase OafA/YrhL